MIPFSEPPLHIQRYRITAALTQLRSFKSKYRGAISSLQLISFVFSMVVQWNQETLGSKPPVIFKNYTHSINYVCFDGFEKNDWDRDIRGDREGSRKKHQHTSAMLLLVVILKFIFSKFKFQETHHFYGGGCEIHVSSDTSTFHK